MTTNEAVTFGTKFSGWYKQFPEADPTAVWVARAGSGGGGSDLAIPSPSPAGFISYWYRVPLHDSTGGLALGSATTPSSPYIAPILSAWAHPSTQAVNTGQITFLIYHQYSTDGTTMYPGLILGGDSFGCYYNGLSSTAIPNDGNWHHMQISWNMGGPNASDPALGIIIENPPSLASSSPTGAYWTVDYNAPLAFDTAGTVYNGTSLALQGPGGAFSLTMDNMYLYSVGALAQYPNLQNFVGDLGEIYCYFGRYHIDLLKQVQTLENINAALASTKDPNNEDEPIFSIPLGPGGSFPLGVGPTIPWLMRGAPVTFLMNTNSAPFTYVQDIMNSAYTGTLAEALSDPFGNGQPTPY